MGYDSTLQIIHIIEIGGIVEPIKVLIFEFRNLYAKWRNQFENFLIGACVRKIQLVVEYEYISLRSYVEFMILSFWVGGSRLFFPSNYNLIIVLISG